MYKARLSEYVIGFVLSIALTLAAFFVVLRPGFFHLDQGGVLVAILILALVQLLVQLLFFLHIGHETGARWNLGILLTAISIIFIIVAASLWIMGHLNYNMTPADMTQYMLNQEHAGGF